MQLVCTTVIPSDITIWWILAVFKQWHECKDISSESKYNG